MIYRKEIDGLRALAVVPVILFHGGFDWLSGGYVGVDIFFVISGYLITSIILKEKEVGIFTITGFYERRARRILPALFFVLLMSLPFAWLWLLPHELENFGESLVAVPVFLSNVLFWQESGYFAEDAELIPLLHTWSLAVEEQFYIIFPLIMIVFWSFGTRWLLAIISLIALLSLGLSEWAWRDYPDANFYLIPTRAWELMVGALVAFYLYYNTQASKMLSQFGSLLGLSLLLYAIVFFDQSIPFPSLYALIPVLGSAFIILFTTPHTWVYRLLSLRLMVGIGLVSYSAYLWHLPLFVFARIYTIDELAPWLIGLLSIITFVLAYLSWRFIENPFRNKQRFSRKQIFTMGAIASVLFVAVGVGLIASDGAMFRYA